MACGEGLSVAVLQRMNTRESCGVYGRCVRPLDDLVIEHLMLVRALEHLNAREELYCRMTVEGFTHREIAMEMGCSPMTVSRVAQQLRWTLYGYDAEDAARKVA